MESWHFWLASSTESVRELKRPTRWRMLACFKNIYRSFRFGDNVIPLFGSSFVFMVLSCFVAVMAIFYSIVFGKIPLFKKKEQRWALSSRQTFMARDRERSNGINNIFSIRIDSFFAISSDWIIIIRIVIGNKNTTLLCSLNDSHAVFLDTILYNGDLGKRYFSHNVSDYFQVQK